MLIIDVRYRRKVYNDIRYMYIGLRSDQSDIGVSDITDHGYRLAVHTGKSRKLSNFRNLSSVNYILRHFEPGSVLNFRYTIA